MRHELFGQPYETLQDVKRILKEQAWYRAHEIWPGREELIWPALYNVLIQGLESGILQHGKLWPLVYPTLKEEDAA